MSAFLCPWGRFLEHQPRWCAYLGNWSLYESPRASAHPEVQRASPAHDQSVITRPRPVPVIRWRQLSGCLPHRLGGSSCSASRQEARVHQCRDHNAPRIPVAASNWGFASSVAWLGRVGLTKTPAKCAAVRSGPARRIPSPSLQSGDPESDRSGVRRDPCARWTPGSSHRRGRRSPAAPRNTEKKASAMVEQSTRHPTGGIEGAGIHKQCVKGFRRGQPRRGSADIGNGMKRTHVVDGPTGS